MSRPVFSLRLRFRSFRYAFAGIAFMLRTQHNAWIHAAATVSVVGCGLLVGLSRDDWKWLVLTLIAVWTAETMNTAFEYVCDVVSPTLNHKVEKAKDIAAGAVLIASTGAVILGALIFWPYLVS